VNTRRRASAVRRRGRVRAAPTCSTPLNAARVEELGAGLDVPPDAPADELADAVRTVLADGGFRAAGQRLAAAAASVGHGELATDLVDTVAPALTSLG
jgi:UDP:flavonoid glycosyltransferase YjiC (YdhE family)